MTIWDMAAPFVLIALALGALFVPAIRGGLLVLIGLRGRDNL